MLVVTSPKLAGLAVVGIPLAVLPIALGGRRVRKASETSQNRVAEANTRAGATLDAAAKRVRLQALLTATAIVLFFGAIVLVLWSGAQAVIAGTMSAGTL